MYKFAMRKAAEAKSALVSKEAANNSTELVLIILVTVVIAIAVGLALKAILGDKDNGVISNIGSRISGAPNKVDPTNS